MTEDFEVNDTGTMNVLEQQAKRIEVYENALTLIVALHEGYRGGNTSRSEGRKRGYALTANIAKKALNQGEHDNG